MAVPAAQATADAAVTGQESRDATRDSQTPATDAPRDTTAPSSPAVPPKEVGRHDERRAVFCPAVAFGGHIPSPASAAAVRLLNNASYQVRDAVNGALRDLKVRAMEDPADAVQIVGVNWTERGNLCAVVCEGFTSAQLLVHADTVAKAAGLGDSFTANRDLPLFKAVLCNVPTKRADGTLFMEAEVLADLRAHSTIFDSLHLADSTDSARWISTTGVRTQKPRSTLLLNFASEADAERFVAMHRRLFVFGCMCEPGQFQPRDRERICTRCWNPLARHRERDYACRERCRLCGGEHIEEDHTCSACDVLAKPCAHIKLRCVNCGLEHAADDAVCEHRRRARGTSISAPPMSGRSGPREEQKSTPKPKKKKGRKVRILEPHEPFPDDTPDQTSTSHTPRAVPDPPVHAPQPVPAATTSTPMGKSPLERRGQSQGTGTGRQGGEGLSADDTEVASGSDVHQDGEDEMELDVAEKAALCELMGTEKVHEVVQVGPSTQRAADDTTNAAPRRSGSSRIAAAEAVREERRRKVAHVLVRNFKFLDHRHAVDALKTRLDASTVSWAAEEQAQRNKPGMQSKSSASLRKIAEEMAKMSAEERPTPGVDRTTPTSVPVNA